MMHTWLLMMTLCSTPGNCKDIAIDEFDSASECGAAIARSVTKQLTIKPDEPLTFFCNQQGEKRV